MIIDEFFIGFKAHLRINNDYTFDDANIMQKLEAALSQVERFVGYPLQIEEVNVATEFIAGYGFLKPIPNNGLFYLLNKPYMCDAAGKTYIEGLSGRPMLKYKVGFETLKQIPKHIIEAVYKLGSHLYHYRGDALNRSMIGGTSRSVENMNNPLKDSGALALLSTERVYSY
jgi:Phage gp6-like head-tail connector protein